MKLLQLILLFTLLLSCGKTPTSRSSDTEESGTTAGNPNTSYRLLPFVISGTGPEDVKLCLHKIVIENQEHLVNQEFEIDQNPVVIFTNLSASSISGSIKLILDNTCGANFSLEAEGLSTTERKEIVFVKNSVNLTDQIDLTPATSAGIFNNAFLSNLSGSF